MLQSLAGSISIVGLIAFLILGSPFLATLLLAFIILIVYEVYGFFGIIGIKLSALPVVSLVTAVGLAVEFCAHFLIAYSMNGKEESNLERVRKSLEEVFLAVLDGGLSTILGISMLALSPFGFVVKYFFGVYLAVVAIGLFNGLLLLPV